MAQPTLRDLATVILRDLMRTTRTKLVILVVLFVASIVAEREGYLSVGLPGENPVAIVILAFLVRAVNLRVTIEIPKSGGYFTHQLPPREPSIPDRDARMGLFPPMTAGLLLRIVVVLGLMALIAVGNAANDGPPIITLVAMLVVLALVLGRREHSGVPLMDDYLVDCPVCDGHGYLLDDDDSEIECEQCDGSGKVLAERGETQAG
jgi:hypothetical protein